MTPGGGWHTEVRQSMLDLLSGAIDKLRNEGFAVASIDYRVADDAAKMFDVLTDCYDALRYLVRNTQIFGIDASSIVTTGRSAGGQLALMLAYAPHDKFRDDNSIIEKFNVKVAAPLSPVAVISDRSYHILNDLADVYNDVNDLSEVGETEPINYVMNSDSIMSERALREIYLKG